MAEVTYTPDESGFAELGLSRGMSDAMVAAAETGAAYYRNVVAKRSGHLAENVKVVRVNVPAGRNGELRAGAMILSMMPYAAAYEWRYGRHALAQAASVIDGRTRWESSAFRGSRSTRATTRAAKTRASNRVRRMAAGQQRRRASQG